MSYDVLLFVVTIIVRFAN